MKILIVDDNEQSLYMLQKLLEGSGFQVVTATNGVEALEKAGHERVDMVISDILMPRMDGFRLCREWKKDEQLGKIPFIFYTATYTDPKDEQLALGLGAERFIVKPAEPDELMESIQSVINDVKKGKIRSKKPALDEEKDVFKLYRERMVKKLEKKLLDLEREITERKRAEEEKEKLQARLLQAQKMEAVGRLAGGVAHDFNNLLCAIQGYTELMLMEVDQANPLYNNLKEIYQVALRAADLPRQLLLFSRKQPMELISLNINSAIKDLIKMLKPLIGEDITINIDLEHELGMVRGDKARIEQVIMNLAINARDTMPQGGNLIIKTENITLDEERCKTIPEAKPGKFVCLSVADIGLGMDKETIQHIFEPFFTTKETGKGTGLGLSVVYGIVRQHDGWINVYSEPGRGSVFKIYLPTLSAKPEDEIKETISLQELQGSGERILLVEDEKGVREFAKRALGKNGYVVFEAANTKEALDIFEREKGNFHLVFSDVVLPDKSGVELADQLLSRKPGLRILLSSGYLNDKSQWPVIRERGFRFLQKPYGVSDLLQAIREAIPEDTK